MNKYLIFLISLFLLASCGTSPDDNFDNVDWCYNYDFRLSDYDFNIPAGLWLEDSGLITGAGLLSFSYDYGSIVTPTGVFVTVVRPSGVTGNIDITAGGLLYGITASGSATMPTDRETIIFTPANPGDGGSAINATIDAGSKEILIEKIQVVGTGASPFGSNPCAEATPTATTTATSPPGETATPGEDYVIEWDFTTQDYNFSQYTASTGIGGEWVDGIGYRSTDGQLTMVLNGITSLQNVTQVEMLYKTSCCPGSSFTNMVAGDIYFDTGVRYKVLDGDGWTFNNSATVSPSVQWATWAKTPGTPDAKNITGISLYWSMQVGGFAQVSKMRFTISGTPPEATATPAPTDTPVPSPTATACATSGTYRFNLDSGETEISLVSGRGFFSTSAYSSPEGDDANIWAENMGGSATGWQANFDLSAVLPSGYAVTRIQIESYVEGSAGSTYYIMDGGGGVINSHVQNSTANNNWLLYGWTGMNWTASSIELAHHVAHASNRSFADFIDIDYDVPCTPSPTPEGSPTPSPTPSPTGTQTPFVVPTNTPFNFQPTVDLTFVSPTTAPPSRTPFPQSTAYLTEAPGVGTPTLTNGEAIENEAEYLILEEQQRSNNVVENLLQDIYDALTGQAGDGGEIFGTPEPGTGGAGTGGDWGATITDAIAGIGIAIGNVSSLFGQAMGSVTGLFSSYVNAQPIAIPGLPLCMTAPLQHDICAIYYILDWTVFAPGTTGAFIVPLLMAILNVIVIFRTLAYVLKLMKQIQGVT